MINTGKDRKRLSRIIKVDFGKGVGISLEELELEFDEMIDGLEQQQENSDTYNASKSRNTNSTKLANFDRSLCASTTCLDDKATTMTETFDSRNKKWRHYSDEASTSDYTLTSNIKNYCKSETCSIDLETDVFISNNADVSDQWSHVSSSTTIKEKKSPMRNPLTWFHKKPFSQQQPSEKQVLVPPVLIDGELTSSYQYLTPTLCNISEKKQRSSTMDKLIRKSTEDISKKKRKESSLQAMYDATVGGSQSQLL